MDKKEVSEIRKTVTSYGIISKLCGCYVNHEKRKLLVYKNLFAALEEREENRYTALIRKSLSGKIDGSLFNLDLVKAAREKLPMYELLRRLNDSALSDDSVIDEFYDAVIERFPYGENYLIFLVNSAYDVPGKASDGSELEDASDYIHRFINVIICPVKLSKEGLFYNEDKNNIETRMTDWVVGDPLSAMMFPSFNERYTDDHELLLYLKKDDSAVGELLKNMFDCTVPLSAKKQKAAVTELLEETIAGKCSPETVTDIYGELGRRADCEEDYKKNITGEELKNILSDSGVPEEALSGFEKSYEEKLSGNEKIPAENLINRKAVIIKTGNVEIKAEPEIASDIEERIIDGRKYLLIPVSEYIKINDVRTKL